MNRVEATAVERRKVSHLVIVASSGAVLVGVIVLLIKVRSVSPEPQIEPTEPAQATAHAASPLQSSPQPTPAGSSEPQLPTAARDVPAQPAETAPESPRPQLPAEPAREEPPRPRAPRREYPPPPPPTPGIQDNMRDVTRAFDRGDYAEARAAALDVLSRKPFPHAAERMLRIAASSSCALGEADQARAYYDKLSPIGQSDIARACSRYGIEF
jgi:hypothetical protein